MNHSNPIANSDPNGDYSKGVAYILSLLHGAHGIVQNKKTGEWGYKYSLSRFPGAKGVDYGPPPQTKQAGNRTTSANNVVGLKFQDNPKSKDNKNSKTSWLQGAFDWLNNSWMNHRGTTWDNYRENRGGLNHQKAGIVWTAAPDEQTESMETSTTNNILFMAPYAMPGLNAGGSPGVRSNRFNYKGIDLQFNFSDWSNSIQSLIGGINDVKDYISGDKPLIQRVGPKSYFDTSKKFEYQKKLWHIRAKDGDTIENAYDGEKTPIPNF